MRLEAQKLLRDILDAAKLIDEFVAGKGFLDYTDDPMLQSAVERQFEIIGEAMSQLAKLEATPALQISDYRRIIDFRNVLIHGYATVDDELVWDVIETKLPVLLSEVDALIESD